jgi:hypothetical protein
MLVATVIVAATLPAHGQRRDLAAPPRFAHVVGRVGGGSTWLFSNLLYESNATTARCAAPSTRAPSRAA